ncbi:response regulator [Belliella kenyensis]|uniref:Response regulator n=1 Tax=Belliella kenyensis TaxID=1472724 RepID=A0ABV8EH87_9BACT|nr:response regulator [Belliella kenyensis]MCH7400915.1 response regulator [Belliella kenyensis]MDN3603914.1 response regulator [Belliella kenyensis]
MNELKARIIFVDDDKIQHMINRKNMLRLNPNLELIFFENPYSALDWLESGEADLLLLDINMPEMSGWEFLENLENRGIQIPAYMLSSSMDPEDIDRSNSYAAVKGFLIKPLQISAIQSLLE